MISVVRPAIRKTWRSITEFISEDEQIISIYIQVAQFSSNKSEVMFIDRGLVASKCNTRNTLGSWYTIPHELHDTHVGKEWHDNHTLHTRVVWAL